MAENNAQTPENNDVESFVTMFTAGLEEQPNPVTDATPPANPEQGDQGSDNGTEGAPSAGTQAPESETPEQKSTTEDKDKAAESEENKTKVEDVFAKSDKAFAELRTTNKKQGSFLVELAKAANLNPKNAEEALRLLEEQYNRIDAKNKGITTNTLNEIRAKDEALSEAERTQIKTEAQVGFDKLKQTYGLNNSQLLAFAQKLQGSGINPFEMRVDLVKEYRHAEFDSSIAKAREEGRQEEINRRTKAQTQASNPGNKVGTTQGTGESIKNPDDLRALLGIT